MKLSAPQQWRGLFIAALMLAVSGFNVLQAGAVSGNISPLAIQIDKNANLYPGDSDANILNPGATADWVKDSLTNSDPATLVNSVATGIIPGTTGASGGKGHWNGVRIVDGFDGNDQDIFLSGGKENDLSTWNIGPGTVGSSKYDITQAYLANNRTSLFFGMERRGNNGTTAFDFEFNQKAPLAATPQFPNRTVGDVLFTFEMQGSGGSGSATPHYFTWNGSKYVEKIPKPASLISSINISPVPAAPWGFVTSKGVWALGSLDNFEFAEAAVNLADAFPNFNPCNNRAFVQVRTRASAGDTSDLKDTTKIFEFLFGGPTAAASLDVSCDQQFSYDGSASVDSSGGTALAYSWDFKAPAGVTLSGTGVTGPDASGVYHSTAKTGTVNVTLPAGTNSAAITVKLTVIEGGTCVASTANQTVTVYRKLSATATLGSLCDLKIPYDSNVSGGKAPYTYAWQFQKNSADDGTGTWTTVGTSTAASGTFTASSAGLYRALLTVKDTADGAPNGKPQCQTSATSNSVTVFTTVGGTVKLTPDCDDTFAFAATGTGGDAPYTFDWTIQKLVSGSWVTAKTFTTGPALSSSGTLDVDDFNAGANGDGHYRAKVTITDSQSAGCSVTLTSNEINVTHGLTASASKTSADGNALSVTLTGSSASGASLQWQVFKGGVWTNIAGATGTTLTYSSFEADDTASATSFTIGTDNYVGKLWAVQLRVHAERTVNGVVCEANSPAVTVKKVTAVDP